MFFIMKKKSIHSVRYFNDDLNFLKVFVVLIHVMHREIQAKKKQIFDIIKINFYYLKKSLNNMCIYVFILFWMNVSLLYQLNNNIYN